MKKTMTHRGVEAMKTLLIFVLIVLMLVLLILLLLGQSSRNRESVLPADRMVVYAAGAETGYARGMETGRVLPTVLAFRENDVEDAGELRCLYAADTMAKPYAALYETLRTLFGADGHAAVLGEDTGAALWKALSAGTETYLYLAYQGALPPSVIRAYTYPEEDSETETTVLDATPHGDTVYVKEVFLLSLGRAAALLSSVSAENTGMVVGTDETEDRICAVTRDGAGNVAVFRLCGDGENDADTPMPGAETTPDFGAESTSDASASPEDGIAAASYTDEMTTVNDVLTAVRSLAAEAQGAEFLSGGDDPTALSLDGVYRMPTLTVTVWDPETALFSGENAQDNAHTAAEVLSLLGMDGDDADNYYTDSGGGRVYLNADGRLHLTRDGQIVYSALRGGGIPVTDSLGYASVGGSYLLSEYLRAADRLLDRLSACDTALGGGDMTPALYQVAGSGGTSDTEDSGIVITYIYTVNGIPVTDGDGAPLAAMTLTAQNGMITSLALFACRAELGSTDEGTYLLPQTVVRDAMRAEREAVSETVAEPESADTETAQETGSGEDSADVSAEPESPDTEITENAPLVMRYVVPADGGECYAEWVILG